MNISRGFRRLTIASAFAALAGISVIFILWALTGRFPTALQFMVGLVIFAGGVDFFIALLGVIERRESR